VCSQSSELGAGRAPGEAFAGSEVSHAEREKLRLVRQLLVHAEESLENYPADAKALLRAADKICKELQQQQEKKAS
jgi:hypothetical protein